MIRARANYRLGGLLVLVGAALSGCGLYVPAKDPFLDDTAAPVGRVVSKRGSYEQRLIDHIQCEIALGLVAADSRFQLEWLRHWGTSVTLTYAVQEQGGVNPSFSFGGPLENAVNTFRRGGNVVTQQNYSTSFGVGFLGSTLRTETIQYTYKNEDILKRFNEKATCEAYRDGFQIDSDLRIREFVFDKIGIAYNGSGNLADPTGGRWSLYNALTEELYFNASVSGSVNPAWKYATSTFGQSSNLLAGARTFSNDLIVTLGPTKPGKPGPNTPVELTQAAQAQHNAKVTASAISTALR